MKNRFVAMSLILAVGLIPKPEVVRAAQVPEPIMRALQQNGITLQAAGQVWDEILAAIGMNLGTNYEWVKNLEPLARAAIQRAATLAEAIMVSPPDVRNRLLGQIAFRIYEVARTVPAEALRAVLGKPSTWKNILRGAASAEFIIGVTIILLTATFSPIVGRVQVSRNILEVKAREDAASMHTLGLLFDGLSSGRVKLLPGLSVTQAVAKVQENMEIGRPVFTNVLYLRPCPNLAGAWGGELVVKDLRGTATFRVGQVVAVSGDGFVVSEQPEDCSATLTVRGEQVSGGLARSISLPRQTGRGPEREEQDTFVLNENPTGTMTRAELTLYGIGSGSLQGDLKVEIERRLPNGALVVLGGILKPARGGLPVDGSSGSLQKGEQGWVVYYLINEFTCCKEKEGEEPPHPARIDRKASVKKNPNARLVGNQVFATREEAQLWLCSHRICPHAWAGSWTNIGGVTLTRTPCRINCQ